MGDLNNYLDVLTKRRPFFARHYPDMPNYVWKGMVLEKLEKAAPYNFFLTRVEDSARTHVEELTITFPELLDKSLGVLDHSVHVNFMVDMPWLLAQYEANDLLFSPMTIVSEMTPLNKPQNWNIQFVIIPSNYKYGKMHTKMSIFFYKDKSVRFAVYTANLMECDWLNRTQGVWISPKCPYMGDDIPINYGESATLFKLDIVKYMASYNKPELNEWIFRIQKCDLSDIKVCLVASVPGQHYDNSFGYKKLNKLLLEHVSLPTTTDWDYVVQCSSIGFLGDSPDLWYKVFSKSLHGNGEGEYVPAKIIFPSYGVVAKSYDGVDGASCIPYTSKVHRTQKWVRSYCHLWYSNHRHRSKALPHIKTYARLTKDGKQLAWFLLSSANLSKAAWGVSKPNGIYEIMSHELGVLFLPSFFDCGETFKIKKGGFIGKNSLTFPLPYDVPLQRYRPGDVVFLLDRHTTLFD